MTLPLTVQPAGSPPFLGLQQCDLSAGCSAEIAVLGVPYGVPYGMAGVDNNTSGAPAAIRTQSQRFGRFIDHYDYDLGGPLLDGRAVRIVDYGDVPGDPLDILGNAARATQAVKQMLAGGAMPIVLGGDDSIPIPVLRAYEGRGPITLVQIDAHIDWRDEVDGVREGFSSPMRRASEMVWIGPMIQIGMRGVGSARPADVRDAKARAEIITAREVHELGVGAALARIPGGGPYFVTIDCDGLDPAVMPAVGAPVPGGLSFLQAADLVRGVAALGPVAGVCLVELDAAHDVTGLTTLTACRLLLNLIGAVVRNGQFDPR
jgi:agmatinase